METKTIKSQYESPMMQESALTTAKNQVLCASAEGQMDLSVSIQSMGEWQ